MHKGSRGFSLTESLIVIAIVLIIAAIAVPNFWHSRIAANQASAVACLRTLNAAEASFSSTFGGGFSRDMTSLAPPPPGTNPTSSAAGLIDSVLAQGSKSGYSITYLPGATDPTGEIDSYVILAVPNGTSSGSAIYSTDQSGVVRYVGNSGGSTANAYPPAVNTPTACSESGNVVTVSSNLNPPVGSVVYWSGATPAAYNSGTDGWVVTGSGSGSFSFRNPNAGLGVCTSTGTLVLP